MVDRVSVLTDGDLLGSVTGRLVDVLKDTAATATVWKIPLLSTTTKASSTSLFPPKASWTKRRETRGVMTKMMKL